MVDIQVRNLTKFFVIGENLLDNLSFEIQEGERVAILGRNGCGKTTLFNILTGQMDYDSGEVYVNPNKRLGLISQIPKFPAGYTVEDVLRTAYSGLMKVKARMERLEADMAGGATAEQLREYVAQVVLNRVADSRFPDTVKGVITQPGQYATKYATQAATDSIKSADSQNGTYYYAMCEAAVKKAMMGQVDMPSNVLYQANFAQGKGVWQSVYFNSGWYASTSYFCYG